MKTSFLFFFLTFFNFLIAQYNFLEQPLINTGSYYYHCQVSFIDIDNDGDKDIICSDSGNNKVSWFENNNLTFTEHVLPSISTPYGIHPIDLDGDGDLDILAGSNWDGLVWFENDGNLNFTKIIIPINFGYNTNSPTSVQALDMDGDGDLDIVSTIKTGNTYYWLKNDGNQNFTAIIGSTIDQYTYNRASDVIAIDIDLDGDFDLVTVSEYGESVVFYENNGSQVFTKNTLTQGVIGYAYNVKVDDIEGDGDLDIVVASYGYGVTLFENDGSENFTLKRLTTTYTNCFDIEIIDINNDCEKDILFTNNNQMHCLRNIGNNNFTDTVIADTTGYACFILSDDLDGDNKDDFLLLSSTKLKWYSNNIIPELTICTEELIHNSCINTCQGSINISVINGTPPYNYLWSNGAISQDITGLCPGDYTITITDFLNIEYKDTLTITEPEIIFNSTNTTCLLPNGSIDLEIINSSGSYSYYWNNGITSEDLNFINHSLYYVTVTGNSCTMTDSITLINNGEPFDTIINYIGCDFLTVNGVFYDTSVMVIDTFTSLFGCDSIINSNIIINKSFSDTVEFIVSCDTVNLNGIHYYLDQTISDTFNTIDGCDSIEYTYIEVNFNIDGQILNSDNNPLFNSKVLLIDYNYLDQTLTIIDSTTTDFLGSFSFDTIANNFYIKAIPFLYLYPNELPTYFHSSTVFQYANALNCLSDINFNTITGINPGGNGFISGYIANGAGKNSEFGEPIPELNLFLINNNTNNVVEITSSKADGYFSFDSLECGIFKIWIDDATVDNSLSPLLNIENTDCILEDLNFSYKDGTLSLLSAETNTTEVINDFFLLYPNPANDIIEIKGLNLEKCNIKIFNSLGLVYSKFNSSKSIINCKDWSKGVYYIEILKSEKSLGVQKLIIK